MRRLGKDVLVLLLLTALMVALAMFWPEDDKPRLPVRSLEEIKRSGKLIVLTQNTPTVYYLDRHEQESGPEYELVTAFARSLGVTPVFIVKSSVVEVMDAIRRGAGDLASAGLSITPERERQVLFGPSYQQVSQQVVCRRGEQWPRKVADLAETDLVIIAGSSYEERLKRLQKSYPDLSWDATSGLNAELLLEKIWRRELGCTVMDSTIVSINQRYYPELRVRFTLGEKDSLAWAMPRGARQLQRRARQWFAEFEAEGKAARLREYYYGHVKLFDYVDTQAFKRRIEARYPQYATLFAEAAEQHGLSPTLLAAQSYQESHWDPRAKSPTGVRGMMMLTLPTARAMGVKSRLNAKQSIFGGARYLAHLRTMLAGEIQEPDLTWLSLAAYNVGLGHLRDAQTLARRQGKDPRRWHDVKEVLPLLSDKKYYRTLRYGYARGSEPVHYVQQIREYEHILQQHLGEVQNELALFRSEEKAVIEEN